MTLIEMGTSRVLLDAASQILSTGIYAVSWLGVVLVCNVMWDGFDAVARAFMLAIVLIIVSCSSLAWLLRWVNRASWVVVLSVHDRPAITV